MVILANENAVTVAVMGIRLVGGRKSGAGGMMKFWIGRTVSDGQHWSGVVVSHLAQML